MRKWVLFLIFVLLFIAPRAAFSADEAERIKIENEINRLEARLKETTNFAKRTQLESLIQGQQKRLEKVKAELQAPTAEVAVISTPESVPDGEALKAERIIRAKFDLGVSGGIFSEGSNFFVGIKCPLPFVFGPARSALSVSVGMVQSDDLRQRFSVTRLDGLLCFAPGWLAGIDSYLGAGLNYAGIITEGRAGTIGGEIYYGVEDEGFGGKVFGEVGWGILRSGFSPSYKGTLLNLGYRREINL